MIAVFDRVLERAVTYLAYVAASIIGLIFVMIVLDVTARTIGATPPGITMTVVEYALLYFAMCSAPWLVRQRGHVAIEALVTVLPSVIQKFLAKSVYLACTISSLMFAYFSMILLFDALKSMEFDLRGVEVPLWLLFAPMPLAFTLISFEFLMYLIGLRSYYNYDLTEVKDSV